MRKASRTVMFSLAAAALFLAPLPARAGSCFHVRAKCKVCWKTTKAEFIHPHTSSGQYLEAYCFKSGCGLGFHVAEAFAHASQHTNGNFHFKTWDWDAGFSSASSHASHGHCSLPSAEQSQALCAEEVRPPARAGSEGAFGIAEFEASDISEGVRIEFLPESHLQVDARGLVRPSDHSYSAIHVAVGGSETSPEYSGMITLRITGDDESPSLTQKGIFSDAVLEIEQNRRTPEIYLVSLRDVYAVVPAMSAEDSLIDLDIDAYHDGSQTEGGRVSECPDE
jgi:hypothetical protein